MCCMCFDVKQNTQSAVLVFISVCCHENETESHVHTFYLFCCSWLLLLQWKQRVWLCCRHCADNLNVAQVPQNYSDFYTLSLTQNFSVSVLRLRLFVFLFFFICSYNIINGSSVHGSRIAYTENISNHSLTRPDDASLPALLQSGTIRGVLTVQSLLVNKGVGSGVCVRNIFLSI